ncbi:MAG TPA: hypothetical protein VF045_06870 [Acidimicrobiales bacterium]
MRWRVEYEQALIDWMRRQRPSLLQVIAVVEWAQERRSLGIPADTVCLPDPDPEYPDDVLTTIPLAHVDVRFMANDEISDGPLLFVRRFASH